MKRKEREVIKRNILEKVGYLPLYGFVTKRAVKEKENNFFLFDFKGMERELQSHFSFVQLLNSKVGYYFGPSHHRNGASSVTHMRLLT